MSETKLFLSEADGVRLEVMIREINHFLSGTSDSEVILHNAGSGRE